MSLRLLTSTFATFLGILAVVPFSLQSSTLTDNLFPVYSQAKKISETINWEKSNFETEQQYRNRLISINHNLGEYQIVVKPSKKYEYDINSKTIKVNLDYSYGFRNEKFLFDKHIVYKEVVKSKNRGNIVCQNGFGATFNYTVQYANSDRYILMLSEDQSYALTYQFALSPEEAKKYVEADEKSLNDKLRFIVKFKPVVPYYKKEREIFGRPCPQDELSRILAQATGSTFVSDIMAHQLFIRISSVQLVDTSTGQVILQKQY
ncbi:hypothetical protein N0824_02629 [Microcystis sp. 0824]|uniref:Uncharacterized protein n=1 Tax=Microcystis aeruginosa NIES-298 TaxID=449468 RepID=A0A2H6BXW6_MICAE|nr:MULTISPECIES: hypothetical protein [Microcystis]MCA2622403.1 hypothetical protein [Microcystis sp. M19BS1]MCA2634019.1 hypothetical protein [Microcystis sp. M20BS1]QHU84074.1 hypothetical protein D3800_12490 [Microcystis aeruginosa NIES-298]GBD55004.1 hypothetical protein BGM30_40970 [Microcystis aeruginosa NIES-298]GBE96976.1 hypothetical protein NIES298_12250 [Microcystis aeruginosa NIES-298]